MQALPLFETKCVGPFETRLTSLVLETLRLAARSIAVSGGAVLCSVRKTSKYFALRSLGDTYRFEAEALKCVRGCQSAQKPPQQAALRLTLSQLRAALPATYAGLVKTTAVV